MDTKPIGSLILGGIVQYQILPDDCYQYYKELSATAAKAFALRFILLLLMCGVSVYLCIIGQWIATVVILFLVAIFSFFLILSPRINAKRMIDQKIYLGPKTMEIQNEKILISSRKSNFELSIDDCYRFSETKSFIVIQHNIGLVLFVPKKNAPAELLGLMPQRNH
jgi:hypothetical protein